MDTPRTTFYVVAWRGSTAQAMPASDGAVVYSPLMSATRCVVGFTGHRELSDEARVRRALDEVLARLEAEGRPLAVVASAAAGADTLLLEAARERDLPATVILPFPIERFRTDFTAGQWARASAVIDAAEHVEVVAAGDDRERGFVGAGLRTIDRAEIVVAVWNRLPPKGPAGTGAMVDHARRLGRRLVVVDPDTGAVTEEPEASASDQAPAVAPDRPRLRRIISLDGGGVFGVFSLQVLARIEEHFRAAHARDTLVLADVVDLFAGTSTGALIATCLSWGMAVADIERLYFDHGQTLFQQAPWYRRHRSRYSTEAMSAFFERRFRDADGATATLGSSRLRTMLLVVMRNASTGAPWPVTNNPAAMFNDPALPDCNLRIPLWQILRASTAAPTYFPPQEIDVAGERRLFVDGGVTAYNNPALIAVLMATLPRYRMCWPASRRELHVTSVGTGSIRATLPRKRATAIHLKDQIAATIPALIGAASIEQDLICRVLGDCVHGAPLDLEVGDLRTPTLFAAGEQKFTYARYDLAFDRDLDRPLAAAEAAMDNLKLMPVLKEAGMRYASRSVMAEHLYPAGRAGLRGMSALVRP